MNNLSAQEIIAKEYNGSKNFMTPNIEEYGKINDTIAYELSSGKFMENLLFGVTIVKYNPSDKSTQSIHDLTAPFSTLKDAKAYIEKLKERYQ